MKAIEHRLNIFSADLDTLAADIQPLLPEENKIDLASKGSRPLFLLFRNGEIKAVVDGCNSPALKAAMDKFLP